MDQGLLSCWREENSMVKIPLYNQGLGPSQKVTPTRVGARANIGTFTAPGQATMRLAEASSQLAFQFGMQEKNAETTRVSRQITTDLNQEMNDFTNANEANKVEDYQAQAKVKGEELRKKYLSKNNLAGLTRNQKRDIELKFDTDLAAKIATGTQVAFTKQQATRSQVLQQYQDDTIAQMRSADPESGLFSYLQTQLNNSIDDAVAQGLKSKYTKSSAQKELSASAFANDSQAASTPNDIDKLKTGLEKDRSNLTSAEYQRRFGVINQAEDRVDLIERDAVFEQIINNKEGVLDTPEKMEYVVKQIRGGDKIEITTNQGDEIFIDFSTMKQSNRDFLITKLRATAASDKTKADSDALINASNLINGMSLEALKLMRDKIFGKREDGEFLSFPNVKGIAGRNSLESKINVEIRERQQKVLQQSVRKEKEISAAIQSDNGEVSEDTANMVAALAQDYKSADRIDLAEALTLEVEAQSNAATAFKSVEFESLGQQNAVLNTLIEGKGTATGARTLEIYRKAITKRDKNIQEDFVGYFQRRNVDSENNPKPMPSPSELIDIQLRMGIRTGDVRVTSDAELSNFTANYNEEGLSRPEKSQRLIQFIQSKGLEHENRVMKHLISTNRITFAEHLSAVYPNDVNMGTIVDGNSAPEIENFKKRLPKTLRTDVDLAVTRILGDYSSSIVGGVADGVVGVGATEGRKSHLSQMQDTVGNAAKHLMTFQPQYLDDPEGAVKLIYESVIGKHFVFEEINKSQMRLPKELSGVSKDMVSVLKHSAFQDQNYLRDKIIFPKTPEGKNEKDYQNEYLRDLVRGGSWRTTVDNTGVFLVDHLGNLVPMKASLDFVPQDGVEGFGGFVAVDLDKVVSFAGEFSEMPVQGRTIQDRLNKVFETKKLF